MSVATEFERLMKDADLAAKLATIQNLQEFQHLHSKMLADGIIQKRDYNLAPVNVLGASIPGQTTYRVALGN